MVNSTPLWDIPYAEDADPRALWPTTSQDVADRLEEVLEERASSHEAHGWVYGLSGALSAGVPTMVGYGGSASAVGDFTYNGSDTFTYTGSPRAFVIGGGIGVVSSSPGFVLTLELLVNGSLEGRVNQSGGLVQSATLVRPVTLHPGDTVALRVTTDTAGCEARDPYLHLIAV